MDMPYWQYRVLLLEGDQAGGGKGNGTAKEVRSVCRIATAEVSLAEVAPAPNMRL